MSNRRLAAAPTRAEFAGTQPIGEACVSTGAEPEVRHGDDGSPAPYFHDDSGAVRFWVRTHQGHLVGASIRKEILHFRFRAAADGSDALSVYLAHRGEIDAAVLRRIADGSIEPVMLREANL